MMGRPGAANGLGQRHGLPLREPDSNGCLHVSGKRPSVPRDRAGQPVMLVIRKMRALPEALRVGSVQYDDIIHGRRAR
jgi:hypothetical protein